MASLVIALRRASAPALFAALILAGAIDAWAGRTSYQAGDSASYMNMVSQITQGHFAEAINGTWSPLYPLLLSAFVWPIEPNMELEFTIVRVVNFGIFVTTLFLFRDFLRRFLDRYESMPPIAGARFEPLHRDHIAAGAWTAFALACFSLNIVSRVSADCLVIAITIAVASTLLSFRENTSISRFVAFGLLLGLGYWAKSILFVMAFAFIVAALAERSVRAAKWRLLLSVAIFAVMAAPLIALQSARYDHPTFSESGRLNYAWFVNGAPMAIHWQGEGPESQGEPVHRAEIIHRNPDVYAWDAPVPVSYHPWYDPGYWYAGLEARFDVGQQWAAIVRNLVSVYDIVTMRWPLVVPLLLALSLWLLSKPWTRLRDHVGAFLPLWLIATANVGVYVLVFLIDRYLAAALSLLWLLVFSLAAVPRQGAARRVLNVLIPALCIVGVLAVCGPRLARAAIVIVETRGDVRDERWAVREEFRRIGIQRGVAVASIGEAMVNDWHRLAEVRIVAEIPATNGFERLGQTTLFWLLDAAEKNEVMAAFRSAGAEWVVANDVPTGADVSGWTPIGDSGFYYRRTDMPFVDN